MATHRSSSQVVTQDLYVDQIYRQKNLVSTYAIPKLLPSEAACFIHFRDDLIGRRVLDLGCGAGRLANYLLPLVARYTGLDVSPYMIDYCQKRFSAEFFEGDMRDLSIFVGGTFDTILGVSNLFDAVSHADRLRVLAEVYRVLAPEGLLIFSAHNRKFVGINEEPKLEWHRNPLTQLRRLLDYREARRNRRRFKRAQRFEPDYAIINDSGNNFAALHDYVAREVQLRQLVNAGFRPLQCFDSRGHALSEADGDTICPSIHYVLSVNPLRRPAVRARLTATDYHQQYFCTNSMTSPNKTSPRND